MLCIPRLVYVLFWPVSRSRSSSEGTKDEKSQRWRGHSRIVRPRPSLFMHFFAILRRKVSGCLTSSFTSLHCTFQLLSLYLNNMMACLSSLTPPSLHRPAYGFDGCLFITIPTTSTGIKETKNYSRIEGVMAHTEHEVSEIVRELDQATRTTSKFTDSHRVNGIPQRFLTKYLIVRLNDHLINEKVRVVCSYVWYCSFGTCNCPGGVVFLLFDVILPLYPFHLLTIQTIRKRSRDCMLN